MAADEVNKLKLHLIHAQEKCDISIELPADEAGDVLTVRHLSSRVHEVTGVPPSNQKIIFKGKSLGNQKLSLKELGLKDGSKIMLIGKKLNTEDDSLMKQMGPIEKSISQAEKKLSDIIYEVDGIHRGYLAQKLEADAITKLERRLLSINEEFTRQLEKLDSLVLSEAAAEVKTNRKNLVKRIQTLLDRSDGIHSGLNEMMNNIKSE